MRAPRLSSKDRIAWWLPLWRSGRRGANAGKASTVFLLLSAVFGTLTVVLTPPLRGPDEPAHFLRAYALSKGEIVPFLTDAEGRKGILIPARLQQQMELFERSLGRHRKAEERFSYAEIFPEYTRLRGGGSADERTQVFKHYGGSEGYSPVPYLPYLPAVALARVFEFDFLNMLYLMRASGFIVLTVAMAYAIVVVPHLKWAFVAIAMLPSALYGRAVLSPDASALACTMLILGLFLRCAPRIAAFKAWQLSFWMALCALTKPPQIAFVFLAAMPFRFKTPAHWKVSLILALPALILWAVWTAASSADVAAWRMTDGTTLQPEHYDPIWKLQFLLHHPWHFLALLAGTYHYLDDYWLQLIGILGWLDVRLQPWIYPCLTILLIAVFCGNSGVDVARWRPIVAVAAIGVAAYCLAVFLIFYLVWTGLDAPQVEGVQGRYFVVVLPWIAVILATLVNRGFANGTQASIAIFAGCLSGVAVIEAILRVDWKFSLFPI